jgi:hypothetical protein
MRSEQIDFKPARYRVELACSPRFFRAGRADQPSRAWSSGQASRRSYHVRLGFVDQLVGQTLETIGQGRSLYRLYLPSQRQMPSLCLWANVLAYAYRVGVL